MTWKRADERAPDIRGGQRAVVADAIEQVAGLPMSTVAVWLQDLHPGITEHQVKRLREAFDLPGAPVGRPTVDRCPNGHVKTGWRTEANGRRYRRCLECSRTRKATSRQFC